MIQRQSHHAHRPHERAETWRERLLSYATVTATAALIWIWASSQTRQSGEANCRVHFLPADADTQTVGPEEPISVQVEFVGSKTAVDNAVNALNGRVFDFKIGTAGIPSTTGGHEVMLSQIIADMPVIANSGASIRSVLPSSTHIAIDAVIRREARIVVRQARQGALRRCSYEPTTAIVWVPEALASKLPASLTVEAVAPSTDARDAEVALTLPAEIAAVVGRVRIEPAKLMLHAEE